MITVDIIEPFYGGSHKQLIDFLTDAISRNSPPGKFNVKLNTLPAKKWHWRARTSALNFAQTIPTTESEEKETAETSVLFCSSVLNLAELLSLRRDLAEKWRQKIVYFHENQLVYPVRSGKLGGEQRDFQYGYNQVLTAMAADRVVFNSNFNRDSFLDNINSFFNLQPDHKPDTASIKRQIAAKSSVLHFPVKIDDDLPFEEKEDDQPPVLHIVWPHRWEHDKNPESFFKVLFRLKSENYSFKVSVLGESFAQFPEIFDEAREKLGEEIAHFGRLASKRDYLEVLKAADVAVSTADHEFFGVAMVEAALSGCYPLVPDRLAYPELFPDACTYRTDQQLYKRLREFCRKPRVPRSIWKGKESMSKVTPFDQLETKYLDLFEIV